MPAKIQAISYYLPSKEISNEEFFAEFPHANRISLEKVGVKNRRRVGTGETASDMAFAAAQLLFKEHNIDPQLIDFLILVNLEPDYYTPPTSCVLHGKLNLKKQCGVFEYNHGCSAYVYGLGLAEGVIHSMGATNVLLLTTSVLSNTFHKKDHGSHFIFGDAASATLIKSSEEGGLGPYVYGTDGSGYDKIIVEDGEARNPLNDTSLDELVDEYGNVSAKANFKMDGVGVFLFSMRVVPAMISELLDKSKLNADEIDYFVFHQPNRFLNETLRKKLNISEEKFIHDFENTGNTVQATIPIALKHLMDEGKIKPGTTVVLAGFGVGLSWISTVARF
jgi:3-oxoacyl-[acyl-carrier-protein] synthase-3